MFRDRILRRAIRESPFHKGDLKYVILDLIADKPHYGYEIIRALEERSHGFYVPSPGAVYPTLQMLEEMGYASATERDGKKIYAITDEGRQFLAERQDLADEVRSHMRHFWDFKNIGKMAMVMKELHALESLMGRRLRHAEPEKIRRIREVISRAGAEIESILEE